MDLIEEMTKEYVDENGMVTCEFSFHVSRMEELYPLFKAANGAMAKGHWCITICDACEKYHGGGFVHAEIRED